MMDTTKPEDTVGVNSARVSQKLQHLKALIAPGLIFIIIMAVTITLRNVSVRLLEDEIQQVTEEECRKVSHLLHVNLRERMVALNGVALHLTSNDKTTETEFRTYSDKIVKDRNTSGFIAIAATDHQVNAIWVHPPDSLSPSEFRTMLHSASLNRTLQKLDANQPFAITEPLMLPGSGRGFAVIIPCVLGDRPGYVVGVFTHDIVDTMLLPDRLNYNVQLRQADTLIPTTKALMPSPALQGEGLGKKSFVSVTQSFFLGSQKWDVQVESSSYPGRSRYFFTSGSILTLGTILALLVSILLYRQQVKALKSQTEALDSRSKLASTSDHLANVKEELDLILNNVDEGIILYDEQLVPLQANESFKQTFRALDGRAPLDGNAERHHRAMSALFQNESQYWALFNKLRANPELPVSDEIEIRHGSDEKPRTYQRRATAVCGPGGHRRGYLVIYQDATAKRAIERMKEDFLSSVTHDLRTPVAAIKGFAETMLRSHHMEPATRDEFTGIIRDESSRLEEMIEDLLDLRRMEDGRLDLALGTYNLRMLVDDVVRSMQPLLESHDLRVELDWQGPANRSLSGDAAKMSRALRNILGNSIKYSPYQSRIYIRGVELDDRVELEVADEGPGIPPDEIEHVFEKFFRGANHVRRTQGTGLGLAITKHIIESHGGVISARNSPKRGAIIRIVLPRQFDFSAIGDNSHTNGESDQADFQIPVLKANG